VKTRDLRLFSVDSITAANGGYELRVDTIADCQMIETRLPNLWRVQVVPQNDVWRIWSCPSEFDKRRSQLGPIKPNQVSERLQTFANWSSQIIQIIMRSAERG
jgi:hypothetical protein